jgi:RNA polymerase primary sigma factor
MRPNAAGEEVRAENHAQTREMDALGLYMKEIQRIPLLTVEEERALGARIARGDRAAMDEMVRRNLRFVVLVARPYSHQGVPLEDLINEGNIGLIRAAERFDVQRGFRFISYAVWWIRQAILLYLTEKSRVIRLPVGKVQVLSRLSQATEQLTQALGREPTDAEVGKRLGLPAERVAALRGLPTIAYSLDTPTDGETTEFEADTIEDPNQSDIPTQVENSLRNADIKSAVGDLLDAREADIVGSYFGLESQVPESLGCIGKRYGVTRERIRQLRDRAIWKLRMAPEVEPLAEYAE